MAGSLWERARQTTSATSTPAAARNQSPGRRVHLNQEPLRDEAVEDCTHHISVLPQPTIGHGLALLAAALLLIARLLT
jgi:hypothetical protein